MAVDPKDGKLLYHLTSLDNLASILKNGLVSRKDLSNFDDVAEINIIKHREEWNLDTFVPFHFFAGNPFDGAVQGAYADKHFVFICIQRNFAANNGFMILTQHPLSLDEVILHPYKDGLDLIDWDTMRLRDYFDHKCREICMAECLSPKKIAAIDFQCIFTANDDIKRKVQKLIKDTIGIDSCYISVNPALFRK